MQMIAHHRKADDINAVVGGEEFQAVLNPLPPMLEVLAGDGVPPTQERPPNAAIDAMNHSHISFIEDQLAGHSRHVWTPSATRKKPRGLEALRRIHPHFNNILLKSGWHRSLFKRMSFFQRTSRAAVVYRMSTGCLPRANRPATKRITLRALNGDIPYRTDGRIPLAPRPGNGDQEPVAHHNSSQEFGEGKHLQIQDFHNRHAFAGWRAGRS